MGCAFLAAAAIAAALLVPSAAAAPQAGETWTEPFTGMEFVWVPKGCFRMGSTSGAKHERPVHEVCVKGFWMGKYEVTNAEWRKYRPGHDSGSYEGQALNDERQPVVEVSWEEARGFAVWLSERGHSRFRLPTEAEWEYAARAGTRTERFWGDDANDACRYANVADRTAERQWSNWVVHDCDDGYAVTAPAGSFEPNGFGLYDLLGNVWEWVRDRYGGKYYASASRQDPRGPSVGSVRVLRGGGWLHDPARVRSAYRGRTTPGDRRGIVGFRLLRTPS